jgi:transglutaminase-like putative cysteine protease
MVVLFVLFPRIQGPLWGLPQSTFSGSSGLSDTMSPGSLSELSLSDAVAFRIQFEQLPDKPSRLYWRGPILWDFDGRTWSTASSGRSLPPPDMQALTQPMKYTVTLEPHHQRWMFGMDLPVTVPADATLNHDYQLLSKQPITSRVRYDLASVAAYRLDSALSPADRQRALRIPIESNPRAVTLARSWVANNQDPHAIVAQALVFFRTQPFFYTLVPPLLGAQPVDEFLYETRRGFCEHYASSFVFLMRAAGLPARVVTGYLGGEINSLGDYMIVRQSDAHAWAEVWLPDEGWLRIDPTGAVSPARIEAGIAAALPAGEPLPMLVRLDLEWLRDSRFAWDALANSWNQWVLGYTPDRQSRLLQSMGFGRTSWQDLVIVLMTCCTLVLSVVAAIALRNRPKEKFYPSKRHWERFCRLMGRRGLPRLTHEGPMSYGLRLQARFPEQASDLQKITGLYASLRYGPPTTEPDVAELRERVARL